LQAASGNASSRRLGCIVAKRRTFVNLHAFGILTFLCVCCPISASQEPETELFRQALERLGGESRIQWMESGDTSLHRWEPRRVSEWTGVLVEWDPKKITLVRRNGTGTTTLPGDHAISVEAGWKLEEFANVHRLWVAEKHAEVLRDGQAALKLTGAPRWQQRLIVAEMVQSACHLGQWQVAGTVFSYLIQDEPPALLFATIPLPWSDEALTAGTTLREAALKWLDDPSLAMQLLGASWLLGTNQRERAIGVLQRLAASESTLLSGYARAQLWRTVPPDAILSSHYADWVAQRDALPLVAQAGPTMLLAHRLHQAGEWELAVAEWLRIATLLGERYHLKRSAIDRAVAACKEAGAVAEAERITARYSKSTEGNP